MVPPNFKAFNLAMIQLGQIGLDKARNLAHARDKVAEAAAGVGWDQGPAQMVVLPVRACLLSARRPLVPEALVD